MKRAALALAVALAASLPLAGECATERNPFRVGLVLQSTGVGDPFNGLAFRGFRRAVRTLGVRGRVVAPDPKAGMVPSFLYLARQKYDLVIGYGFFSVGALDRAAVEFPKTTFAIVDASVNDLPHRPSNVRGGVFASQEPSYLAGYLAALMEKRRPGPDVIGSVGGIRIPTVNAYIAGYRPAPARPIQA